MAICSDYFKNFYPPFPSLLFCMVIFLLYGGDTLELIVSHGDGDGICACSITYMNLIEPVVIFAQPFNISDRLFRAYVDGILDDIEEIYILDIAFSDELEKVLERIDKKVTYIDHHSTSKKAVEKYGGIYHSDFSASQLASYYFRFPHYLAIMGAICDKTLLVTKKFHLFNEAELLSKSLVYDVYDDVFRLNLVKNLVEGKKPSEIQEVIERAKKSDEKRKELHELSKNRIIFENHDFLVIDMRDKKDVFGYVGKIATDLCIEKQKTVFVVYDLKNEDKTIITGRAYRENNSIHIGKIMERYGGGGHRFAGSGYINKKMSLERLIDELIEATNQNFH